MDLSDLKCEAAPQKEFFFCQSVFLPVIDNSRCFMFLYGILESYNVINLKAEDIYS
ncbi:hypothetical protein [Blautia wexlerae]|uniref:hypothetical protein n=1 Tax=Blautia wexlerae TaxID=418240 RepID=UPI002E35A3E3|nr:hypothetical protein [Blautia wexlerae]